MDTTFESTEALITRLGVDKLKDETIACLVFSNYLVEFNYHQIYKIQIEHYEISSISKDIIQGIYSSFDSFLIERNTPIEIIGIFIEAVYSQKGHSDDNKHMYSYDCYRCKLDPKEVLMMLEQVLNDRVNDQLTTLEKDENKFKEAFLETLKTCTAFPDMLKAIDEFDENIEDEDILGAELNQIYTDGFKQFKEQMWIQFLSMFPVKILKKFIANNIGDELPMNFAEQMRLYPGADSKYIESQRKSDF